MGGMRDCGRMTTGENTEKKPAKKSRVPRWVRWPLLGFWMLVLALVILRVMLPGIVNGWVTNLVSDAITMSAVASSVSG